MHTYRIPRPLASPRRCSSPPTSARAAAHLSALAAVALPGSRPGVLVRRLPSSRVPGAHPSRAVPADARHGPPPPPATAPTAASLLKEMEAHLCLLYEHPEPIERAARHFLLHWLLTLERIRQLLPDDE